MLAPLLFCLPSYRFPPTPHPVCLLAAAFCPQKTRSQRGLCQASSRCSGSWTPPWEHRSHGLGGPQLYVGPVLDSAELGKSDLLPALMKTMICYQPVGQEVMHLPLDPSGTCEI